MNMLREDIRRMWLKTVGIRFQPLVCLTSGKQVGQEILAMLGPGTEPETFFRSFSHDVCLAQFFEQVDFITQKKLPGLSFLNLPSGILVDTGCLRRLNRLRPCYRKNLVIEIQEPIEMVIADDSRAQAMAAGMNYLSRSGWQIWADYLTPHLCRALNRRQFCFDGVKIDRHEICRHRAYGAASLSALVIEARKLVKGGRNRVVIEGIETMTDLEYARQSGASWGQGYVWPEALLRFR